MSKSGSDGYRPSKQARSVRSEQLLLEAGEALFAENGYQSTKVTDIIERSGCSTGTFYHRFTDKEGLARLMIERFIDEADDVIQSLDLNRNIHGDLPQMLAYLAGGLHDSMTERLGVYRASQRLNTLSSDRSADTGVLVAPLEAHVMTYLDQYRDQITAADPDEALRHALQLIIMVTLQTRLGAGRLFPRDKAGLTQMLVQASLGLLQQGNRS